MKRYLLLFMLLLMPLTMLACGDKNAAAPPDNQPHAANWIKVHPVSALATANFADCTVCHGINLQGSGAVVSCYTCHAFNSDTNFIIHPTSWANPYNDHRAYAATNGKTTCAKCHGADLHGSPAAPSCFSSDFNGLSCHADGPGNVPHPLDGTFFDGAIHGPVAKTDLTVCQACHADAGGPGSNPRFNKGILRVGGIGCEACHIGTTPGANPAHVLPWPALKHSSAGNIAGACTLCHGVKLDGVGGVGINCLNCHSISPADNPTGCGSCHNQPPNGRAPVGDIRPNRQGRHNRLGHSSLISETPGLTCVRCHDGFGFGTSGHFDSSSPADISFQNPDVDDTMTSTSTGTNTTCNGTCHVSGVTMVHENKTWY